MHTGGDELRRLPFSAPQCGRYSGIDFSRLMNYIVYVIKLRKGDNDVHR